MDKGGLLGQLSPGRDVNLKEEGKEQGREGGGNIRGEKTSVTGTTVGHPVGMLMMTKRWRVSPLGERGKTTTTEDMKKRM